MKPTMKLFFKILHIFLVVVTLLSGIVKVIGIRTEFMRITHVGFDDWQITVFGMVQITVALLLVFQKTMKFGAIAYSIVYAYATWYYFSFDLEPKITPILLTIAPLLLLGIRNTQSRKNLNLK